MHFFVLALLLSAAYWYTTVAGYPLTSSVLGFIFFPYYAFLFVAGIAFHALRSSDELSTTTPVIVIAVSLLFSVLMYSPLNPDPTAGVPAMLLIIVFFAMFWLFATNARVLQPLKSGVMVKIGLASYSLYLLHESIGLSVIHRLNEDILQSGIWPFLVAVTMILLSVVFYDWIETPARRFIRRRIPCP